MTEKGKPWDLPFILNPPVSLADYWNVSDQQKELMLKVNVLKDLIQNVALFLVISQTEPTLVQGVEKIPVWQFWNQNFHRFLKGTDATLDLFLSHKKKKSFLFKVIFPLALRILFLMVQWVSCGRQRSWLKSKDIDSLLKPIRAQERCVPSCHVWLLISQRSVHLNCCWLVHFC